MEGVRTVVSILDIDMDFFLDSIAHWINSDDRLDDNYIPWTEEDFRHFLEGRCLLSKDKRIKGRIVRNHHEAFFFWDELIKSNVITVPFKVTHVDAHSDTGLGDSGYVYIMKELINKPIKERRDSLDATKVYMGNYLAFALACGWIDQVDFVLHESWDNDISRSHLKNFDITERMFQFKNYPRNVDISMCYHNILSGKTPPTSVDKEIPFNLIPWKSYVSEESYDFIVFCQSPGYTPRAADFMMDIIKEYIFEV